MLPATKTVPKEMLPLVDKPVSNISLRRRLPLASRISWCDQPAKSAMDDYFDYYPELEERLERGGKDKELAQVRRAADLANIFYVRQKETKGLGHAIWRAKRFVATSPSPFCSATTLCARPRRS
jgi:UTP--glucose-1-phosphate uridylyltransferase